MMPFFGKSNKNTPPGGDTGAGDTDARLDAFGAAERAAAPVRPGRFAAVAARLQTSAAPVRSAARPRPALLWGGGALVAASLGVAMMVAPPGGSDATARSGAQKVTYTTPTTAVSKPRRAPKPSDFGTMIRKGLYADAAPTFNTANYSGGDMPYLHSGELTPVPFTVSFYNSGDPVTGEIVVSARRLGNNTWERRTVHPVTIAGGGRKTYKTICATMISSTYAKAHITLQVAGRGPVVLYSQRDDDSEQYKDYRVALLSGKNHRFNFAALAPNFASVRPEHRYDQQYVTNFAAMVAPPENAPERADGYSDMTHVVIGRGSEVMTTAQWDALREYVKRGGALIFPGGTGTESLREHPVAKELCPATAGRRFLGAGTVTLLAFDPTRKSLRNDPALFAHTWKVVTTESAPPFGTDGTAPARWQRPWEEYVMNARYPVKLPADVAPLAYGQTDPAVPNPFRSALPPLPTVLYLFLGYFVLVVPVSFVALKQTRRLHLAWATGPLLATCFAGGIGVLTLPLYLAPQSYRTQGDLVIEAGENSAHFSGYSELFTPRGGRYTFDIPGKGRTVDGGNGGSSSPTIDITDNGDDQSPPAVDVPNLAFRRLYHAQTVPLGTGVTADLHTEADGTLAGTITNGTGLTMNGVMISMRGTTPISYTVPTHTNAKPYVVHSVNPVYYYRMAYLRQGVNRVHLARSTFSNREINDGLDKDVDGYCHFDQSLQRSLIGKMRGAVTLWHPLVYPVDTPYLTALTSGKPFGPQHLGQSAGGDASVSVLVHLPKLNQPPAPLGGVVSRNTAPTLGGIAQ